MFGQPQAEHQWLEQLVGTWTVETTCQAASETQPQIVNGQLVCRSLGGLWFALEGTTPNPDGAPWTTIMTLGYDPRQGKYVGTFIGSMMTHQWVYVGEVDQSGSRLVLDCRGPKMEGEGLANYRDTIEIKSPDEYTLSSEIEQDDGTWNHFMTAIHRRQTVD